MNIPNGANKIISARKKGFKPADMVIISLIGHVNEGNPIVHANPSGEYDWRWLVGLNVCVYIKPGITWKPILMQIARNKPEWLGIYDADQFQGADVSALPMVADIEKPMSLWRWRLDLLPWMAFQNEEFSWGL